MRIEIIPCLQDNYRYLIIDESNNSACIVDPSEAEPIREAYGRLYPKLQIDYILKD